MVVAKIISDIFTRKMNNLDLSNFIFHFEDEVSKEKKSMKLNNNKENSEIREINSKILFYFK